MPVFGYARVSSTDQDLSIQEAALRAAGCEMIRAEKKSGTTTTGRTELQNLMDFASVISACNSPASTANSTHWSCASAS